MYKKSDLITTYIAFDCETTGLIKESNLLTICFILLDKELKEIDKLNLSIKYESYNVNPEAMKVNKIDLYQHTKNCKSINIKEANIQLMDFLNFYCSANKLIPLGHGIDFDINAIKNNNLLSDEEYNKFINHRKLDTHSVSEFLKISGYIPYGTSSSLVNLTNHFKISLIKELEHTAEYDIKQTIEVLKRMKKLIEE